MLTFLISWSAFLALSMIMDSNKPTDDQSILHLFLNLLTGDCMAVSLVSLGLSYVSFQTEEHRPLKFKHSNGYTWPI